MNPMRRPSYQPQTNKNGFLDSLSNRSKAALLVTALTAAGVSAVLCNGGTAVDSPPESSEKLKPNDDPKRKVRVDNDTVRPPSDDGEKSSGGAPELIFIEGEDDGAVDGQEEEKEDLKLADYIRVTNYGLEEPKPEDLPESSGNEEVLVLTDCESLNEGETLTSYSQLEEIFRRPNNIVGVTWPSQDAKDLVLDYSNKIDGESSCMFSVGTDVADHKGADEYAQINEWFWAGPHQTINLERFVDVGTIGVWLYIPEGAIDHFKFLQVYLGNNDGFEHPVTKEFIEGNFWIFYADEEHQNLAEGWNKIEIPLAQYAVQQDVNGVEFSSVGFMAYILMHDYPPGEVHEGFRLDNVTVSRPMEE